MKICIVLSALGATLVSATALSQAPAQQPSPPSAAPSSMSSAFTSLDADKDGKISEAEAQASRVVAQSFSQADANHDGAISKEEFGSAFTMSAPAAPPPLPPSE
jgi:Ca2+-binding EF-hand superfamily protein